jgi:DNA-binding NtrC family response regulator
MPVIMMSGHATIETAVEATKIGAMAFLEKPVTLQKLLKAVEQGLARNTVQKRDPRLEIQSQYFAAAPEDAQVGNPSESLPLSASQMFELDRPLRDAKDDFERAYFQFHLTKEMGSMTRVADKTGLERTHLYRKLKQLGVDVSRGGKQRYNI